MKMVEKLIGERMYIDSIQFRFMPGHGTTNAIFLLGKLQGKYLGKKNLYFGFVDLEKIFDRVSHDVVWRSMRNLGVE